MKNPFIQFISVAAILLLQSGCTDPIGSQNQHASPSPRTSPSQATSQTHTASRAETPVPLSIVRYIVETDWQTSGSWNDGAGPPYPEHPSEKFVRDVWAKSTLERVDLNRDGLMDMVVDLNFSPGVSGNTSYHIITQQNGRWRHAGVLDGNYYRALPGRTSTGYLDINTRWRNGGGAFTATTYRYHKGRYQRLRSHVELPQEGEEPIISQSKEYVLK